MHRIFFLLLIHTVFTQGWWMLENLPRSMADPFDASMCARLPSLTKRQREICGRHSKVMSVAVKGMQIALSECERTFEGEMWNCTEEARKATGTPNTVASKETAYIYALSAAGVTHSIAKACASGELEECGCGPLPSASSRSFLWSGCSDNVRFGNTFGRKFIDADEKQKADARSLMNLHNSRLGRRLLASGMQKACKCHGVSGSCVTKTCWKVVPKMDAFADDLKKKFGNALQVSVARVGNSMQLRTSENPSQSGRTGRYLKKDSDASRVARHLLVFLDPSPDLCDNSQYVTGRECGEKCREVCCGRGWDTVRRVVDEPCKCVFQWCCEVKCQRCSAIKETHYCK